MRKEIHAEFKFKASPAHSHRRDSLPVSSLSLKSFSENSSLRRHVLRKHQDPTESERLFDCPECPERFGTRPELEKHLHQVGHSSFHRVKEESVTVDSDGNDPKLNGKLVAIVSLQRIAEL